MLEDVFVRVGTPYRVIGGVRFYERREIKDLLAYARILVNPADDESVRRVVNVPRRGIGDKTVQALSDMARREGISFLDACLRVEEATTLGPRAVSAVQGFTGLLAQLQQLADGGTELPELVEQLWELTGYMADVQAEKTIEALSREENLRELQSVAREFVERTPDATLSEFLESVTLVSEQDALDEDEGAGHDDDPAQRQGARVPGGVPRRHGGRGVPARAVPDRRRRARGGAPPGVRGHHPRRRTGSTSPTPTIACCGAGPPTTRRRGSSARSRPSSSSSGRRSATGSAARRVRDVEVVQFEGEEFAVGMRVLHTKFGEGAIAALAGEGEQAEATVDFDSVGRKQLLLAYAPAGVCRLVTDLLAVLGIVFVAELGDKSQLLALALAARHRAAIVLAGIAGAAATMLGIAVVVGAIAGQTLPQRPVQVVAGLLFVGFGIWTLREDDEDEDVEMRRR